MGTTEMSSKPEQPPFKVGDMVSWRAESLAAGLREIDDRFMVREIEQFGLIVGSWDRWRVKLAGCPQRWFWARDFVKCVPYFPEPPEVVPSPPATDAVNLPDHYLRYKIEPIRFGVENYGRGVLVTKIAKYVMRAPFKGKWVEDLEKARRCLEMLTKFDAGDPDWWKHPTGESSNG